MTMSRRVASLSISPVKGLRLQHLSSVELTAQGAIGDRMFYLVDETGRLQSCTRHASLLQLRAEYDTTQGRLVISRSDEVLMDGTVEPGTAVSVDLHGLRTAKAAVLADAGWSRFFSGVIGKPVQLVQALEPAYDVQPVTLIGSASVSALARRAGLPGVDARRFRMLIEFEGGEPHVEDSWDGLLLSVGGALLRGSGPVKRCAATTRNPETGEVDLQTLRLITDYRGRRHTVLGPGATFGTYAEVVEPGMVSVGDTLTVRAAQR